MFDGLKRPGLCACCDDECYEITERYPLDHPFQGQPKAVKNQLGCGRRITFLLTNGTRMDVTMCDGCGEIQAEDYPKLWEKLLRSWAHESDPAYRVALGLPPDPLEHVVRRGAWLKSMTREAILGVLYVTKEQVRNAQGERHECRISCGDPHGKEAH